MYHLKPIPGFISTFSTIFDWLLKKNRTALPHKFRRLHRDYQTMKTADLGGGTKSTHGDGWQGCENDE